MFKYVAKGKEDAAFAMVAEIIDCDHSGGCKLTELIVDFQERLYSMSKGEYDSMFVIEIKSGDVCDVLMEIIQFYDHKKEFDILIYGMKLGDNIIREKRFIHRRIE